MKKAVRTLILTVLALCVTQAAALAADSVSVQLNGEDIAFTYAEPRIVDGRTFLPVRAVFEEMGAEVSYDNGVVTARRDGRTVTMTIGSAEAVVSENGETTPLTMDVAPFIDPALGSTYVPVRFAAEALGSSVGWDADTRTVLILDTDREAASLLEGRSFTWMDKLLNYTNKYNNGIWDSGLTMTGTVKVDMSEPENGLTLALSVPVSVTASAVTQDSSKMEGNVVVTADLASARTLLTEGMEDEDIAQIDAIIAAVAKDGVSCGIRCDLTAGILYCKPDLSALGEYAALAGVQTDAWYRLDMSAIYEEQGLSLEELTAAARDIKTRDLLEMILESSLGAVPLNDTSSYQELHGIMSALVDFMSDDSFKRSGDTCVSEWSMEQDGVALKISVALSLKGDELTGYAVDMGATGSAGETGVFAFDCRMSLDEEDHLGGSVTLNVGTMVDAAFEMTGSYKQGSAAPATEPPAGAEIIDLFDL